MSSELTAIRDLGEKRRSFCQKVILELKNDFVNKRWVFGLCLFLFFLWFIGNAVAVVYCYYWANDLLYDRTCRPDGDFRLIRDPYESYNAWSASTFFQITASSGELSFTQAKVIDVVWDVVSEN